jgi:AcrR family transcriptional regulator
MPRPRTATDASILEATYRVVARLGPGRLTLADVGREVGLAPATLVQRFGSKRGLLLALARAGAESVGECFAALRAAYPSPLEGLIAAATEMTRHTATPEELANGLAFLQMDVSDPDFRALALASSRKVHAGYAALIGEAVAAGELAPCDAPRLARAVAAVSGGSLIAWAIHREGSAEDWVRADLAALLDPYRAPGQRDGPPGTSRGRGAKAVKRPRRKATR